MHPDHLIYSSRCHLFLFREGILQWSSGRDDFLLELLYKPSGWREFNSGVPFRELLNLKYDFGLERFYIVEVPLEAVLVLAAVPIPAVFPYNNNSNQGQRRGKGLSRVRHTERVKVRNPKGFPDVHSYGGLVEYEGVGVFDEFVGCSISVECEGVVGCAVPGWFVGCGFFVEWEGVMGCVVFVELEGCGVFVEFVCHDVRAVVGKVLCGVKESFLRLFWGVGLRKAFCGSSGVRGWVCHSGYRVRVSVHLAVGVNEYIINIAQKLCKVPRSKYTS